MSIRYSSLSLQEANNKVAVILNKLTNLVFIFVVFMFSLKFRLKFYVFILLILKIHFKGVLSEAEN